jgi:hypothetical protein
MKEVDKNDNNNKIRILFLSANPRGTKKLDLIKESNAIEDEIDSAGYGDQFSFKQRNEASVSRLQQFLIKYKPQIVHFAGHGNDAAETGIFLFQDSKGKKEPASKEDIADLFRILNERKIITKRDKIRLVVLNACFSKELADEIAKYVDCVIGMHNQVNDTAARIFAESFYRGIASRQSVDTALDLGRNQLALLKIPKEHMIPGISVRKGIDPNKMTFVVSDRTADSGKSTENASGPLIKAKQKIKKAKNKATTVDAEEISKGTIDANQQIGEVENDATTVRIGRVG